MLWDYITNPLTNKKISIYSRNGKQLIKNYIHQDGGRKKNPCDNLKKNKVPKCSDKAECKWIKSKGCFVIDTEKVTQPKTKVTVKTKPKVSKVTVKTKPKVSKVKVKTNPKVSKVKVKTKHEPTLVPKPESSEGPVLTDSIWTPGNGAVTYSGFRPSVELTQYIYDQGGSLVPKVTDAVKFLIVKKRGGTLTKKIQQARDLDINIIYLDQIVIPKTEHAPVEQINISAARPVSGTECVSGNTGTVVYRGALLLAKNYKERGTGDPLIDPTGWWASEKFDGYRALWDGSKFLTRTGNNITVPDWFSALMPPSIALDGELWMGRGGFRSCGLFRHKKACSATWVDSDVLFKVFDIPSSNKPFEERMKDLETVVNNRCACMIKLELPNKVIKVKCPIQKAKQVKVKNSKHLEKLFDAMVAQGGEGMMIRKPGSLYEPKRSSTLLKYKVTYDTECKITGYKLGTGKYTGMLGSFQCQLLQGSNKPFYISGVTDEVRVNYMTTHPIGTVVTILYNDSLKDGVPRHPRYFRKRDDYEF
tara:strand:+ start:6616 stop:8211 length:1596 start_codon:yes stop_codon:yes gene_type:complete